MRAIGRDFAFPDIQTLSRDITICSHAAERCDIRRCGPA